MRTRSYPNLLPASMAVAQLPESDITTQAYHIARIRGKEPWQNSCHQSTPTWVQVSNANQEGWTTNAGQIRYPFSP